MTEPHYTDLIQQLEQADGPSRGLDAEITLCIAREKHPDARFVDSRRHIIAFAPGLKTNPSSSFPRYTASLDDALALMPSAWLVIQISEINADGMPLGELAAPGAGDTAIASGRTMVLSACAAAVKARRADWKAQEGRAE